jgi:hypothetical protein
MFDLVEQSGASQNSDAAGNTAAEDSNTSAVADDSLYGANPDSQEQTEEAPEEDGELEVDGKKFTLPKSTVEKLKAERLMQADYTQKTQAAAEERKSIAAEREQVQRQAKEQQQYVQEMAAVVAIDQQLAQYTALDWNALIESDPVRAMQLQQQQKALEGQRSTAQQSLTQKQQQFALEKQQSFAKQIQDADDYMSREIPGFKTGRNDELAKYAAGIGMSPEATAKAIIKNPVIAKLLHKADLYDKLLAKQTPKPPPVAEAKPAIRVGSNATVKKDPTKMTDAEFAAYRRNVSKRK